jgi:hypothetical protein
VPEPKMILMCYQEKNLRGRTDERTKHGLSKTRMEEAGADLAFPECRMPWPPVAAINTIPTGA